MFKPHQKVIRIIKTPGGEVGSFHVICRTERSRGLVGLESDEHIMYDRNTGTEVDPAGGFVAAGITSRIIAIDGEY